MSSISQVRDQVVSAAALGQIVQGTDLQYWKTLLHNAGYIGIQDCKGDNALMLTAKQYGLLPINDVSHREVTHSWECFVTHRLINAASEPHYPMLRNYAVGILNAVEKGAGVILCTKDSKPIINWLNDTYPRQAKEYNLLSQNDKDKLDAQMKAVIDHLEKLVEAQIGAYNCPCGRSHIVIEPEVEVAKPNATDAKDITKMLLAKAKAVGIKGHGARWVQVREWLHAKKGERVYEAAQRWMDNNALFGGSEADLSFWISTRTL